LHDARIRRESTIAGIEIDVIGRLITRNISEERDACTDDEAILPSLIEELTRNLLTISGD